jgi:hypothetical protein
MVLVTCSDGQNYSFLSLYYSRVDVYIMLDIQMHSMISSSYVIDMVHETRIFNDLQKLSFIIFHIFDSKLNITRKIFEYDQIRSKTRLNLTSGLLVRH